MATHYGETLSSTKLIMCREDGRKPYATHKQLSFRKIYDIKMDFTRKARLVAEGCKTSNPVTSTYTVVVSRDIVSI